ncbi:MAG TPA: hypothetical protein VEJ18_02985, partial [Planctomycetota bacterium]|nr:hypothetical protein [Planctomycetota bacterium]
LHEGEEDQSYGARSTLRIKGNENFALFQFDLSPYKGRTIEEARLHLVPAGEHRLYRVGVSTVASAWIEGKGNGKAAEPGEPCFLEAARGQRPWAHPGSDFHAVSFGRGGSVWDVREVRAEPDGRISVDIPPAVLHAILEGNSCGFVLSDDKGQTGHNNSVYAREQSASKPSLVIVKSKPGAPPPSGARMWTAPPAAAVNDRRFLPAYAPAPAPGPAALGDARWRILPESRPHADAASDGRIWDGRGVTIDAARGEHVAFLLELQIPGAERPLALSGDGWSFHRVLPVGDAYDPLVPADGPASGRVVVHVERHLPTATAPGEQRAPFTLSLGAAKAEVPVLVRVHSAVLPDRLGFHVSLNGYRSPGEWSGKRARTPEFLALEKAAHRLAHEHRATIAIVPYSHRGSVDEGMAPPLKRDGLRVAVDTWDAWDARWGPYFDGTAFKGLPRDGVPIDHAYLPMHENWPLPLNDFYLYKGKIEDHWRDAPPIEKAWKPGYAEGFKDIVREVGRHLVEKGWTKTDFHVYLNNKDRIRYERKEWEGSWWTLDEPSCQDDYRAIGWFGRLFQEAKKDVPGTSMRFRIDLSRPQWRRNYLDGVVDLDIISRAYQRYPECVFNRGEDVWIYSGLSGPSAQADHPRSWCLQAFLDGGNGVVPWLALGTPQAWEKPEATAAVLPPRKGEDVPRATLRLKMLRRGQQDVELLRLLLEKRAWSRAEIRRDVAEALGLRQSFRGSASADDPGHAEFSEIDPGRYEAVRTALLRALDEK